MPLVPKPWDDNYSQLVTAHDGKDLDELAGSVAYHKTLIEQHRQLQPVVCRSQLDSAADSDHVRKSPMLRSWIPFGGGPHLSAAQDDRNGKGHHGSCSATGSRAGAVAGASRELATTCDRDTTKASPNQPQLEPTKQDVEEYEALPLAIQRKFFSKAERLRLAQSSGRFLQVANNPVPRPPGTSNRLLSTTDTRSWAAVFDSHDRQSRAAHLDLDIGRDLSQERPVTSPLPAKPDFQGNPDFLGLANLPAKIRDKHLTREEQLLLARQLRQSVLLDAADEARFRQSQTRARHTPAESTSQAASPTPAATPDMPHHSVKKGQRGDQNPPGDSFRWFEEDDELDLRFAVGDPQEVPRSVSAMSKRESQPFRRGLSFTKMSFSRSSMTSFRPSTGESYGPSDTRSASPIQSMQHVRRRSRAFSIMGSRHNPKASVTSIDVAAAHYQDPEARAMLRTCLASPQKFDEAVEFGFPAVDASNGLSRRTSTRLSHRVLSDDNDKLKTFLSDDRSSTYSEDLSMPDPESPKTPQILDKDSIQALELPFDFDERQFKLADGYLHAPAHSREMTLRMTLTRPDLRAQEDQMYGWQAAPREQAAWRQSRILAQGRNDQAPPPNQVRELHKESIDKIFAEIDQEIGPAAAEGGPMKRLWKKVLRS